MLILAQNPQRPVPMTHDFILSDYLTNLNYNNFPLIFFLFLRVQFGREAKSRDVSRTQGNVMRCAIWYHLYNLKNVKNTHGGVLILIKLQTEACNFTKINTPPWVFFAFFKLYRWYQIAQRTTNILYGAFCNQSLPFLAISYCCKALCLRCLWEC